MKLKTSCKSLLKRKPVRRVTGYSELFVASNYFFL